MGINYHGYAKISGRRLGYDRRIDADPKYRGFERRSYEERRKKDNRKFKRFRVKDLTFVKLRTESEIDIGQLLDISQRGLSIRCFINAGKSQTYSDLGIFLSGGGFIIDQIPFKKVSDTEINTKPTFSATIVRRYGVQFDKLTPDQKTKLDYFLANHTLDWAK
jgi:hypothetical protein